MIFDMRMGSNPAWPLLVVCAVGWFFVSCTRSPEARVYEVNGVIQEVKPGGRVVVVKHEEVPGYMMAMTMPFEVKNTNEVVGLAPGDAIIFRLVVTETEGWIEQVRKTGVVTNVIPPGRGIRRVRDVEPLAIGDPLPDYVFTNELNRTVRLAEFRGHTLAFTFFFTRCPYPMFCPRTSTHFSEVQRRLKSMSNGPANWHLLMISFDPEFDTPGILKTYARRYGADPDRWNFLTGALIDIDAITEQFGMLFARDGAGFSHNVRTVVVDPNGRVSDILMGNEWNPEALVGKMVAASAKVPDPVGR